MLPFGAFNWVQDTTNGPNGWMPLPGMASGQGTAYENSGRWPIPVPSVVRLYVAPDDPDTGEGRWCSSYDQPSVGYQLVPPHDHRENIPGSGGFTFACFHPGNSIPMQPWALGLLTSLQNFSSPPPRPPSTAARATPSGRCGCCWTKRGVNPCEAVLRLARELSTRAHPPSQPRRVNIREVLDRYEPDPANDDWNVEAITATIREMSDPPSSADLGRLARHFRRVRRGGAEAAGEGAGERGETGAGGGVRDRFTLIGTMKA